VVNCTPSVLNNFAALQIEYLRLVLDDSEDKEDMKIMRIALPLAVEWLYFHHQILGYNTLVHCHAGVNRSATVVIAYLMKYFEMPLKEAIEFVVLRRQNVFYGGDKGTFKNILQEWEKILKK
jgi:protein-tyrosine phosphatase